MPRSRASLPLLVLALAVLLPVPQSLAQPRQDERAPDGGFEAFQPVVLEVDGFTGTLLPGEPFRLQARVVNRGVGVVEGLRVLGTLHQRAISRFDYQQAIEAGDVGNLWASFASDVDTLGPHGWRRVRLERTAADLGFANPVDKYGIYPMRIQLLQRGEVVDEVITSVILSPDTVETPLRVALVLPLDAAPARLPDGSFLGPEPTTALRPDGRLGGLVESVALRQSTPVTFATTGLFTDQVADLADGHTVASHDGPIDVPVDDIPARRAAAFLTRLRDVAARPEVDVVSLGYGPADLVALVRGGLPGEATRNISEGRSAVESIVDERPVPGILWPPDGLDGSTTTEVLGAGVDTVVLAEDYLGIPEQRDLPSSPSPVRRLRTPAGASVDIAVPDPWLSEILQREQARDGIAVAAQRLIAETAAVYFERPFAERPRGLLLAPPSLWDPPRGLPGALLDRLHAAPWVRQVSLRELVEQIPPDRQAVRLDYPSSSRLGELSPGYVSQLRQARLALGSLTSALPAEDDTPSRFDELLLQASSVHYRDDPSAGLALISQVTGRVDALYGAIRVVETPSVTLTSVEGQIPVTLRNDSDTALRVRLRLQTQRYEFEGGSTQEAVLEPGGTVTMTFAARALIPGGTYPIDVVVEDPEGVLQLARGTVVVRSTAFSGLALIITVGAGLFLIVWWARQATARRKPADRPGERAAA